MPVVTSRPPTARPGQLLPGILLSLGIVAVLTATAAVEQSGDSLAYLAKARGGNGLFHPHHILFNAAVRVVYLGIAAVAGVRDVVLAAQLHNLAFTFVALLAVYWIGLRWLGSQRIGLLGLALFGSTTGILVFSTQAEVYVPAAAALGVAAVFFLGLADDPGSKGVRAGLVVAWVVAVLYHQTAVLFLIPMAAAVLVAKNRDFAKTLAAVSATAGVVVLAAYGFAFRFAAAEADEPLTFLDFVFSYVVRGGDQWGKVSNVGATGGVRLLENHIWGLSALVPGRLWVLVSLVVIGGVTALLAWRFADRRARLLLCFALTWAVTFLGFFLWWFPGEVEFSVLTSMPLCIAAIACASPFFRESRVGTAGSRIATVAIVVVAAANFVGSLWYEVLPRHRSRSEFFHRSRFLSTFDDGSTLRLTKYKVATSTRFYFGASADSIGEVNLLERVIHTGESDLQGMTRSAWDRVMVNIGEIQPWAWHNGRNGFREPETWTRMIHWIFNLRGDGEGWIVDSWEVVSDARGNDYLLVTSGNTMLTDPHQLFQLLIDDLDPQSPARRFFKKWLDENAEP